MECAGSRRFIVLLLLLPLDLSAETLPVAHNAGERTLMRGESHTSTVSGSTSQDQRRLARRDDDRTNEVAGDFDEDEELEDDEVYSGSFLERSRQKLISREESAKVKIIGGDGRALDPVDLGLGSTMYHQNTPEHLHLFPGMVLNTSRRRPCVDGDKGDEPIITKDGAMLECPQLAMMCEGAGDKSIKISQKCKLTCKLCMPLLYNPIIGVSPRDIDCNRRRRSGFCYTRRRRDL